MLAHLVKPEQVGGLVAAGAGRRRRGALGAVRSMTFAAAVRELPMLGLGLFGVTAGAGVHRSNSAVRLVALDALRVAAWSALGLLLVTALTRRLLRAAMRLVAVRALLVPDPGLMRFVRVTRLAASHERGRPVRQPAMATRALRVTTSRRDARKLRGMAAAAQSALALCQRECVGFVTLRTRETSVKFVVAVGGLMAAAATAR